MYYGELENRELGKKKVFGIKATAVLPSKEGAGIESFKLHIYGKRQTSYSS